MNCVVEKANGKVPFLSQTLTYRPIKVPPPLRHTVRPHHSAQLAQTHSLGGAISLSVVIHFLGYLFLFAFNTKFCVVQIMVSFLGGFLRPVVFQCSYGPREGTASVFRVIYR